MTFTRQQAIKNALAQKTNTPGYCQLVTREWIGANSAGDFDGDGASDAEDGWKKEPLKYKHVGDRKPPAGVPVSWVGGSSDNGHRALSLGLNEFGRYMIRSTDAGGPGVVATVPLEWVEQNWGLTYVGWSDTMNGELIPDKPVKPTPPTPPAKSSRGKAIDRALDEAKATLRDLKKSRAKENTLRGKQIALAMHRTELLIKALEKIPLIR